MGRETARAALADFRITVGNCPSPADFATVEVPVVCTYGARSPDSIARFSRALAAAIPGATARRIEGAGHAAAFDATSAYVQLITGTLTA